MAMEKYSTPEQKGKCESCGDKTMVVPVKTDTEKVASSAESDSDNVQLLCSDCK
jgi:hypothetical protein